MNAFKGYIRLSVPHVTLAVLCIGTGVCIYLYLSGVLSVEWATLISGLAAGLLVAIIQFLYSWYEYVETDQLAALGIKRILLTRDDETYYRDLISNAKVRICVLGVTAARFLNDFADEGSPRSEKKVLLNAMTRGVNVQILVADMRFLPTSSHAGFELTQSRMRALSARHGNRFTYQYYEHEPRHAIVAADRNVVVGPYFPEKASKDTPAIHMVSDGTLADAYMEHFRYEWDRARTP